MREEICNYYDRKFDIKYNPKKVLVTVGGSEAIDLMVRTLINPGDEVLIPSLVSFVIALVRLWQAVFLFRLKQRRGQFQTLPEQLKEKITDKTKL